MTPQTRYLAIDLPNLLSPTLEYLLRPATLTDDQIDVRCGVLHLARCDRPSQLLSAWPSSRTKLSSARYTEPTH